MLKKIIAKLIVKLSPLRWAERQLPEHDFAKKIEANSEAIYNAVKSSMADRGEQ
jgi:hypothetical protein